MPVDELVASTRSILSKKAVIELDHEIELASGQMSRHFVDGKAGLSDPDDLRVACAAMAALVEATGVEYDVVGGPTLGADHIAVGISYETGKEWFFVRKEPKGRGTGKQIEGARIGEGTRVLVVEDAVSTGGSFFTAIDVIEATGAMVVAATTLIDRGISCAPEMGRRGIAFCPVTTYADFGMDPILAST
ncbi:MAG: phosphoribosyltransferase family protein [Actinomycetota bacterium]|jgi:orotate phosphoribosyltransferase|nr:phosphoribosyltransferase family protein [Actinomycetota bacterium]